jgi:hypothetical protein
MFKRLNNIKNMVGVGMGSIDRIWNVRVTKCEH